MTGQVGIRIEAEDGIGLRQLRRQLLSVPFGEAPDGDDGLGSARAFEFAGLQEGVDGVLLGLGDESAGVDHGDIGQRRILDENPPRRRETPGEFFRVDLVAGASQGHERDAAGGGRGHGRHSR